MVYSTNTTAIIFHQFFFILLLKRFFVQFPFKKGDEGIISCYSPLPVNRAKGNEIINMIVR